MATFHPQNSHVGIDAMARFLNTELTGDLHEVPGISDKTIEKLARVSVAIVGHGHQVTIPAITSTHGLIGVFMSFKTAGVGPVEHVQRFYLWWCSLGVSAGHRAGVVHALAEKINISFPGLYDSSEYEGM